jgi:hypothetical protein
MAAIKGTVRRKDDGYWITCTECGVEFGPFGRFQETQETRHLCGPCAEKWDAKAEENYREAMRELGGFLRRNLRM